VGLWSFSSFIFQAMTSQNNKQKEKYKNAILYFAKNLDKYQLGKTKLAKLLYYLDFINYREEGESVTGTDYYKQEYGPLAKDLSEIISELVEDEKLKVESSEVDGNQSYTYKATDAVKEDVFNESELILLRKLKNRYADWNTSEIVAKSHLEAPWIQAKKGGELDYSLAVDVDDFDEEAQAEYQKEDRQVKEAFDKVLSK
jgi:uncharacterized phage-associated protein